MFHRMAVIIGDVAGPVVVGTVARTATVEFGDLLVITIEQRQHPVIGAIPVLVNDQRQRQLRFQIGLLARIADGESADDRNAPRQRQHLRNLFVRIYPTQQQPSPSDSAAVTALIIASEASITPTV